MCDLHNVHTQSILYSAFIHCFISFLIVFFFNDTAPTEIYTLSLHDALPISVVHQLRDVRVRWREKETSHAYVVNEHSGFVKDRKSTRLNSSHVRISYAVFCLKKKRKFCQSNQWILCRSALSLLLD